MRIVFICGSLEPGKDGVGDYVRRLSGELVITSNEIIAISLHDKFVESIQDIMQEAANISIRVIRFPSILPWKERIAKSKKIIDFFNPEWLSLQYVPFSFQSKGLPFNLANRLQQLTGFRKWHIMVHELWVGMDETDSIKYKIWGQIQKYILTLILIILKPKVIHTQTKLYKYLLKTMNREAKYLPLFGNIPLTGSAISKTRLQKSSIIRMILFGNIHYGAPVHQFVQEIAAYSYKSGSPVILSLVGRSGAEAVVWINECKSAGLIVEVLGEKPSDFISQVFIEADFGISTTPAVLLEKSGSVAAMIEHGLPVICVARPWHANKFSFSMRDGITVYKAGELSNFLSGNYKKGITITLHSIAKQFLIDLM